jgi:biotin carboxyl carrier protein
LIVRYSISTGDSSYSIDVDEHEARIAVDGQPLSVNLVQVTAPSLFSLLVDGRSYEVFLEEGGRGEYCVVIGGEFYTVHAVTERDAQLARSAPSATRGDGEVVVKAPMPGVVRAVEVAVGDVLRAGQGLVVLEAMKMENEIKAAHAGSVRSISVAKGQRVEQGQALMVIAS